MLSVVYICIHTVILYKATDRYVDNDTHSTCVPPFTDSFCVFFDRHYTTPILYYRCSHCRVFAPAWETLAEIMDDAAEEKMHKEDYTEQSYEYAKKMALPVLIAKVDCVDHATLCFEQQISGYPTVRLFINGKRYANDYWGHRDVYNMMMYLKIAEDNVKEPDRIAHAEQIAKHRMNITDEEKIWTETTVRRHDQTAKAWNPGDHPGCRLSGILWMDRTPGHFYIQAQSPHHDMSPHVTNVSHVVHHLSFGDDRIRQSQQVTPPGFEDSTKPMNGMDYVTTELHTAHHHYLKLVPTNLFSYQVLQSSQLSYYRDDQVPEAKFIIDLSPISVMYRWKTRRWYDYVTSLMAILGGTFTVVGMILSGVRVATTRKPRPGQPRR